MRVWPCNQHSPSIYIFQREEYFNLDNEILPVPSEGSGTLNANDTRQVCTRAVVDSILVDNQI